MVPPAAGNGRVTQPAVPPSLPYILLRPTRGLAALNLRDLWLYRELIYFLTWRDIKVRYKQTILGATWAVLQPVLQMIVFTLIFGNLAQLSSEGVQRELFYFAAILPWALFSKALTDAGRSLVTNRAMITKVYFPRLVIPLASVLAGLVDFGIAFVVLLGLMAYFGVLPTLAVWTLPLFLLLALVSALGVSLWLSALNVIYRDVGQVLPFLAQLWFFITPIVYSSREIVNPSLRLVYALNPMVGVVDGFRWALLGAGNPPGPMLAISSIMAVLVLVSGIFYFRRMERSFADEI
jgi:lipopolysaccharide transport system permease protein